MNGRVGSLRCFLKFAAFLVAFSYLPVFFFSVTTDSTADLQQPKEIEAGSDGTVIEVQTKNEFNRARSGVAPGKVQSKNETIDARSEVINVDTQSKSKTTNVRSKTSDKVMKPTNKPIRARSDVAKLKTHSKNKAAIARPDVKDIEVQSEHTTAHAQSDNDKGIAPVWKCNDTPESRRRTKFVFVHVFKTAGSSIRTLLREYSRACHAGYGTLISCTNVNRASMLQSESHNWKGCKLKEIINRRGQYRRPGMVNNALLKNNLDVVAGHLRLGIADHLVDKQGLPLDVRYLSFFRNAAARFVSGKVYVKMKKNKNKMTIKELLDDIRKEVSNGVAKGKYYSKYDQYLLTPLQKEQLARHKMTIQDTTKLIMQNLLDYNVTIGIVERMPESIEVLHHVLGGDSSAKRGFGMVGKEEMQRFVTNKSPISASAILGEIQKDGEFYQKLLEYVKYEQIITDFAMHLHLKQYKAIKSRS